MFGVEDAAESNGFAHVFLHAACLHSAIVVYHCLVYEVDDKGGVRRHGIRNGSMFLHLFNVHEAIPSMLANSIGNKVSVLKVLAQDAHWFVYVMHRVVENQTELFDVAFKAYRVYSGNIC